MRNGATQGSFHFLPMRTRVRARLIGFGASVGQLQHEPTYTAPQRSAGARGRVHAPHIRSLPKEDEPVASPPVAEPQFNPSLVDGWVAERRTGTLKADVRKSEAREADSPCLSSHGS